MFYKIFAMDVESDGNRITATLICEGDEYILSFPENKEGFIDRTKQIDRALEIAINTIYEKMLDRMDDFKGNTNKQEYKFSLLDEIKEELWNEVDNKIQKESKVKVKDNTKNKEDKVKVLEIKINLLHLILAVIVIAIVLSYFILGS